MWVEIYVRQTLIRKFWWLAFGLFYLLSMKNEYNHVFSTKVWFWIARLRVAFATCSVFPVVFCLAAYVDLLVIVSTPCTVYRTHKFYFSIIFSLKIGPTILFTYLKIILLQCFQFSVFNKISCIQTDLRKLWMRKF